MVDPTPKACGTCIDYNAVSSCCTSRRSTRTSVGPDDSPCRYWTPRPAESAPAPSPAPEGATRGIAAERDLCLSCRRWDGTLCALGRTTHRYGCIEWEAKAPAAPPPAATDGGRLRTAAEELIRRCQDSDLFALPRSAPRLMFDAAVADLAAVLHAPAPAAAATCACGHLHSADSDGGPGPCRDRDCDCMAWLDPAPHLPGIGDHVAAFEARRKAAPTPNRSTEEVIASAPASGLPVTPAVPEQSAGAAAAPPPFVIYDESAPIPPGVFPAAPPPEGETRCVDCRGPVRRIDAQREQYICDACHLAMTAEEAHGREWLASPPSPSTEPGETARACVACQHYVPRDGAPGTGFCDYHVVDVDGGYVCPAFEPLPSPSPEPGEPEWLSEERIGQIDCLARSMGRDWTIEGPRDVEATRQDLLTLIAEVRRLRARGSGTGACCETCRHHGSSPLKDPCWSCPVGRPSRWEPAPSSPAREGNHD